MAAYSSVIITGGSSGIGAALAVALSKPGTVVGITGRDEARLKSVADRCRGRGAEVQIGCFDIRDRCALETFIEKMDSQRPLDLVVANAGVAETLSRGTIVESEGASASQIETNLIGLVDTVEIAVRRMAPQGRGQIALMCSLSAVTPLPHAPVYSATKAAVRAYGDALRPGLADHGVGLSIIFPGYVNTPMERRFSTPKPFLMSAERAAMRIHRGLSKRKAYIAFPWLLYFGATLASRAPVFLRDFIMRQMGEQTS
jgi:short-subunit dehydrogenase